MQISKEYFTEEHYIILLINILNKQSNPLQPKYEPFSNDKMCHFSDYMHLHWQSVGFVFFHLNIRLKLVQVVELIFFQI